MKKAKTNKKSKVKNKSLSFEESIHLIDEEIKKRRIKWSLTALAWMDYEDVSQIIRIHIYKKWHMYDSSKPLAPWLNRIISNQIKNLIRNHYGNYSRPCLRCAAAEGENLCEIYQKQCSDCPLYSDWEKNKKNAYDIKMPLPIENHQHETKSLVEKSKKLKIGRHNIAQFYIDENVNHEKLSNIFISNVDAIQSLLIKKLAKISSYPGILIVSEILQLEALSVTVTI